MCCFTCFLTFGSGESYKFKTDLGNNYKNLNGCHSSTLKTEFSKPKPCLAQMFQMEELLQMLYWA